MSRAYPTPRFQSTARWFMRSTLAADVIPYLQCRLHDILVVGFLRARGGGAHRQRAGEALAADFPLQIMRVRPRDGPVRYATAPPLHTHPCIKSALLYFKCEASDMPPPPQWCKPAQTAALQRFAQAI